MDGAPSEFERNRFDGAPRTASFQEVPADFDVRWGVPSRLIIGNTRTSAATRASSNKVWRWNSRPSSRL